MAGARDGGGARRACVARGHRPAGGWDSRPRRARVHGRRGVGDTDARHRLGGAPAHRGGARPAVSAARSAHPRRVRADHDRRVRGVVDDGRGDPRQLRPAAVHRPSPGHARLASAIARRVALDQRGPGQPGGGGGRGGARRRTALRPGRGGGGACRRCLPARCVVADAGSGGRRVRLRRVVGVPRRDRSRRGRGGDPERARSRRRLSRVVRARRGRARAGHGRRVRPRGPAHQSLVPRPSGDRDRCRPRAAVRGSGPPRGRRRAARAPRRCPRGVRCARRKRRRLGCPGPGGLRDGRLAFRRRGRADRGRQRVARRSRRAARADGGSRPVGAGTTSPGVPRLRRRCGGRERARVRAGGRRCLRCRLRRR